MMLRIVGRSDFMLNLICSMPVSYDVPCSFFHVVIRCPHVFCQSADCSVSYEDACNVLLYLSTDRIIILIV